MTIREVETGNHNTIGFISEESSLFNIRWFMFSGKMLFVSFPFSVLYHKELLRSPCQLKFQSKSICGFGELGFGDEATRLHTCESLRITNTTKIFSAMVSIDFITNRLFKTDLKKLIRLRESLKTS